MTDTSGGNMTMDQFLRNSAVGRLVEVDWKTTSLEESQQEFDHIITKFHDKTHVQVTEIARICRSMSQVSNPVLSENSSLASLVCAPFSCTSCSSTHPCVLSTVQMCTYLSERISESSARENVDTVVM